MNPVLSALHEKEDIRVLLESVVYTRSHLSYPNIDNLFDQIKTCVIRHQHTDNRLIKTQIASLWLQTLALSHAHGKVYYVPEDMPKGIAKLLGQAKAVEYIVSDEEDRLMLAYVCLDAAKTLGKGPFRELAGAVGSLLARWSGKEVDRTTLGSIEDLTRLIYGNATYDLYRDDVKRVDELPEYLLRIRTPVLGLPTSPSFSPNTELVELPTNIDFVP